MKKKNLKELATRELIAELRSKANGVVNSNYKLETREEYRQYLMEILTELGTRKLTEEDSKELNEILSNSESEATEAVEETPVEEVTETTEVVEETPVVEVTETTEVVEETPVEEVTETTEVVEEIPVEEVTEATEVVEKTPVEEVAEATEVVEETPVEEVAEATEVVEENPIEEVPKATEVVEQTPTNKAEKPAKRRRRWRRKAWGAFALIVWVIVMTTLVASLIIKDGVKLPSDGGAGSQVETPVTPGNPEVVVSESFNNGIVNIANTLTNDESIAANVDILVKNIGEDKLVELIGKYGELSVQKSIAQLLVFAPEVKMNQYVVNNELAYNPNAEADYNEMLSNATGAYKAEMGKNADGALMSLDGYDTHKFNREAVKELIIKSGDTALLTWYEVKTSGYDVMFAQKKDTAKAEEYRETVRAELLNSRGTADLLALQLEQEANGTLTVMDNGSMEYTEAYNQFIINNYIYVTANK